MKSNGAEKKIALFVYVPEGNRNSSCETILLSTIEISSPLTLQTYSPIGNSAVVVLKVGILLLTGYNSCF